LTQASIQRANGITPPFSCQKISKEREGELAEYQTEAWTKGDKSTIRSFSLKELPWKGKIKMQSHITS
jgi:hypothetical protein